jgi:predicted RND superfamily exporter protein
MGVAVLIFTNLVLLPILLSYTGVSPAAAQRSLRDELQERDDRAHKKHPFWAFLDLFTPSPLGHGRRGARAGPGGRGPGGEHAVEDRRHRPGRAGVKAGLALQPRQCLYRRQLRREQRRVHRDGQDPQYACAHYSTLHTVDALERELQQLPGVETTSSLAGLAKTANAGMNEGSLKWFEMPRSQDMLNSIITRAPREMFNQNCDLLTLYAYLKDHKADTLTSVVNTVEAFAAKYGTDDIRILNAAGNAGVEAATNIVVKKANTQMLFLVYAAVIVLAFITFRSWRAVVCAVLPLMLTSVLCEALMVGLNIGVKVATLPVIALGVGIGVDYALYVMTVTLTHLKAGMTLSQAYYKALIFTGKVVVLTGITLGIAVATWAWSPIKFQADMGILLAFMFVWNMLGALILLPALAHFLLRPKAAVAHV